MELTELAKQIIFYATVAGAIGVLIKMGLIPVKYIKNVFDGISKSFESLNEKIDTKFDDLNTKIDLMTKRQDEQELETLGIQCIIENMPHEKKYKSCKRYLELHGNSGIEISAQKYIDKYKKSYGESVNEEIL